MSDQYDLFGGKPPSQRGSITSQLAAEKILPSINGLQARVLEALKFNGPATDEQLMDRTSLPPNTLRPRRRELQLKGLIRDSGRTAKTRSGRAAVLWEAVPPN